MGFVQNGERRGRTNHTFVDKLLTEERCITVPQILQN